jgi:Protein of unknown function (DUF4240)
MTTLLEMPLNDVSSSTLHDLQVKYPNGAILRIDVADVVGNKVMDECQFWAIIALLNWRTLNSDAILAPAVQALSGFSKASIHAFHDILNEKLYALDGQRFAEQLGSNKYVPDAKHHFSVDSFLYSRCCVVANGGGFYQNVMQNPAKMPKEYTFESLLYLPREAWKMKTKRDDYAYFPETWVETFSNPDGWKGIVPLKERLNLL